MQGFWTEMLIYENNKNADNIKRLCICELQVFNIYFLWYLLFRPKTS